MTTTQQQRNINATSRKYSTVSRKQHWKLFFLYNQNSLVIFNIIHDGKANIPLNKSKKQKNKINEENNNQLQTTLGTILQGIQQSIYRWWVIYYG